MIKYNYGIILKEVALANGVSRAELARITKLNRSTISYIVDFFLEDNTFILKNEDSSNNRRKGERLYLNYYKEKFLLIDVKYQKIDYYITYLNGEKVSAGRIEVADKSYEQAIISLISLCHEHLIETVGISIHGNYDVTQRQVSSIFYELCAQELIEKFKSAEINLYFENESNIYVNALEGRSKANIHIEDGIGLAMMVDNRLVNGINGDFGTIGHIEVEVDGKACHCGRRGCIEAYGSRVNFINDLNALSGTNYDEAQIIRLFNEQGANEKQLAYLKQITKYYCKVIDISAKVVGTSEINITSSLFASIVQFQVDIDDYFKNTLKSRLRVNYITSAEETLFKHGFADLLVQEIYQLNS